MKMKTKQKIFATLVLILMLGAGVSCTDEKISEKKTAQIQFKLTDAPSLVYDAVYIDIREIVVGVGDEFYDEDGDIDNDGIYEIKWVGVPMQSPGLYNLMDYRNGEMALLAGGEIPAGKISQVRLILGLDSYIVKDGEEYPLQTPSAQVSGIKLNLHEVLLPDLMYSFVIDFDAARSVVQTGNHDKFILKPVIRTYAETFGGSIKGVVTPPDAVVYVQLVKETDTLITFPEIEGKFLFAGLEEGSYDLTVVTDSLSPYADTVFFDVPVENGEVTDLDTIPLISVNQ
jgi:hypothetical protein